MVKLVDSDTGQLAGIAVRDRRRAPMQTLETVLVREKTGLVGDHKGAKFPKRQVTILALEDWTLALNDLKSRRDDPSVLQLDWTMRRANLLVRGVALPKARGGVLKVGDVVLEVTAPTQPCLRIDEVSPGLLKALHPDWRGGVCCRVVEGGPVTIGDVVEVLHRPTPHEIHLPG